MNPLTNLRGRQRPLPFLLGLLLLAALLSIGLAACDGDVQVLPEESEVLSAIGDWVWIDDGDGIQQGEEPGLPDTIVNLYEEGGEQPLASTVTDEDGFYSFDDVAPGRYFLEFIPPDPYVLVPPDMTDDESADSDPDPVTQRTEVFEVEPGTVDDTWDAGAVALEGGVQPTDTPPAPPTNTPIPEAEETPTPAVVVGPPSYSDELNDVLDCAQQTVAPEQDPAADIDYVTVQANDDGSLTIEVYLVSPLEDPTQDYSFAVLITIFYADGSSGTALYEWHDGQLTLVNSAWTALSNGMPGASFNLPSDEVKGREVSELQVEVFHMPTPQSLWVCDQFAFMP